MLPISHQRKLQRETEKREENTIARLSACDSSLFIARNSIVATMQVPRKKKENTSANSTKRLLNTLLRSRERKKIAHVNKHVLNTITLPFLLHNSINIVYILSGENTSLSFQANSVAGQANDYPIMVINRLSFFSSSEKSREKRKRKKERERERALCRFEEGKDRSHVTTQC